MLKLCLLSVFIFFMLWKWIRLYLEVVWFRYYRVGLGEVFLVVYIEIDIILYFLIIIIFFMKNDLNEFFKILNF